MDNENKTTVETTQATEIKVEKNPPITIIVIALVIIAILGFSITNTKFDLDKQLSLGEKYLQDLDYDQAIVTFKNITETEPSNAQSHVGLAQSYVGKGDKDTAISILETAYEIIHDSEIDELLYSLKNPLAVTLSSKVMSVGSTSTIELSGGSLTDEFTAKSSDETKATINENKITALALGEVDITITKGIYTQTIPIQIEPEYVVEWVDKTFENQVRTVLNKPTGDILSSDLLNIKTINIVGDKIFNFEDRPTEKDKYDNDIIENDYILWTSKFSVSNYGADTVLLGYEIGGADGEIYKSFSEIEKLDDLVHFKNLNSFALAFCNISDLSALAGLTNLTFLNLSINKISDISPLAGLTNLTDLQFSNNNISDISILAGFTNLTELDSISNNISDISPLSNLTNLKFLNLPVNNISDISPVTKLTNLTSLSIAKNNNISDISPITGLVDLEVLILDANNISDLSNIAGLTNLERLYISNNNVKDISPLSGLVNLTLLSLSTNNISDLSPVSRLTNMEGLYLSDNKITDISALAGLVNLDSLHLGLNGYIKDISVVANMRNLVNFSLDVNEFVTDFSYTSHIPLISNQRNPYYRG